MEFDVLEQVARFIPVMLSLTVHEWAHAWSAWKLGDDTAKLQGRLTLNPLDHLDPVGAILPFLGIPFGWAKPVPINPLRFRSNVAMSTGLWITAIAGPVSNVMIAVCCGLIIKLMTVLSVDQSAVPVRISFELLWDTLLINLMLAMFNMLPIPPLDGSRIVEGTLPDRFRPAWNKFVSLGPLLLIAIVVLPLLGASLISKMMFWIMNTIGPWLGIEGF